MPDKSQPQDPAALIRNIETRYRAQHRKQLTVLATLAKKIKAVHAGDTRVPVGLTGLTGLLERRIGDRDAHMTKEELILSPAIRKGRMPGHENPTAMMSADHDDHATEVAKIRRPTGILTMPERACGIWTAFCTGLAMFLTELEGHMRRKNDVMFPQFGPD